MQINVYGTAIEAAYAAADLIAERLYISPNIVLGLATGGTMESLYHHLVERHRRTGLSFRFATTFNLDEYIGLAPAHPASYRATMQRLLFDHTDIDPQRTHLPDGMSMNPDQEAVQYEAKIAEAGGIDLQLLGIGRNGHIAFNEPGTSFSSQTHVVTLDRSTQAANARFFLEGEAVPERAITMGISPILASREILLVVTGAEKRTAFSEAFLGQVNPQCPASVLQLHPNVMIYADRAAAIDVTSLNMASPNVGFDKICSRIGADNV
ncbi:MAG: glucosamine-6-phosphate deaminase [Drouetiella hepatica Uher 2000/2452]|jgi:glucosamine-6-phosphate deaminase|uniref:Glucosamine-6-phosphate deaminase n=1 Tax=Drouetiella hepatica Uher 2000/2452 TaxID=904376 RepID=A0A951QCD8_9CYAN|nr:glucosamine-6-phosphate deaminase [Drouetiella hepatica Uher 2000/2452]